MINQTRRGCYCCLTSRRRAGECDEMRCVYAWAQSRVWEVEGGRWSVRRGMREVVRPFEGSQLLSRMRRDDCSDDGVSGDG